MAFITSRGVIVVTILSLCLLASSHAAAQWEDYNAAPAELTSHLDTRAWGGSGSEFVETESSSNYGDFECCQCCPPAWTVTADALFLHRSAPQGYGILFDQSTGSELFNASQLGLGTQAGPRLILLRQLGSGYTLDLEYFGIDGWSTTRDFGPGNLLVTGDRGQSGPPATTADILYASRFRTAEINLRAPGLGWLQPLAGFRWIGLSETYSVLGNGLDPSNPVPYDLHYRTRNNLYGGQLGAAATLWDRGGPLAISALGKAGLFLNDSNSAAGFQAQVGPQNFNLNASTQRNRAAFFGELGFIATWQVTEHIALRGGYQLYWLDGVALAANQPLSTDLQGQTGGINNSGHTFMHGPSAGFQATW